MNNQVMVAAATVAMGVVGILFVTPASANCGAPEIMAKGGASAAGIRLSNAKEAGIAASLRAISRGGSPTMQDSHWQDPGRAIVGMWKFEFVSQGNTGAGIPDGAVLDAGFQTWHADGTEITNSGRPPMTGSFCMGVWDYRHGRYKLNHYALSWDPTGTQFVGPTNIREEVGIDRKGNNLSGEFTIDQYAQDGVTVLAHLGGRFIASRINVD